MADSVNNFFILGPNVEINTDDKSSNVEIRTDDKPSNEESMPGEDKEIDDIVDMLCDMMCGCLEDECYSDEQIDELVSELADKFGFSKKKAKEIVDFVFEWDEQMGE